MCGIIIVNRYSAYSICDGTTSFQNSIKVFISCQLETSQSFVCPLGNGCCTDHDDTTHHSTQYKRGVSTLFPQTQQHPPTNTIPTTLIIHFANTSEHSIHSVHASINFHAFLTFRNVILFYQKNLLSLPRTPPVLDTTFTKGGTCAQAISYR